MQKYVPLDLRPKKTRAIRKRMTKHQVSLPACCTASCRSNLLLQYVSGLQLAQFSGLLEQAQSGQLKLHAIWPAIWRSKSHLVCVQQSNKLEKQKKRASAFPQRKFAVKA